MEIPRIECETRSARESGNVQEKAVMFRNGKGKFEFTVVMYHYDNGHAEKMILPKSSQEYL